MLKQDFDQCLLFLQLCSDLKRNLSFFMVETNADNTARLVTMDRFYRGKRWLCGWVGTMP